MTATPGLGAVPWHAIVVVAIFACLGFYLAARAWQGRAVSRSGNMAVETSFRIFIVTLLPAGGCCLGLTVFGLLTHLDGLDNPVLKVLVFIAEMVSVLVAAISMALAISLFFFFRPRRLVPPHIRRGLDRGRHAG